MKTKGELENHSRLMAAFFRYVGCMTWQTESDKEEKTT